MRWIGTQPDVGQLLDRVAGARAIAVDSEADSLHSYFDKVCLLQMSLPDDDFVIDPLSGIDLSPLGGVLADPSIRKILHGADYDLRILQRDFGFRIRNLTDTMVCAQLLGYEAVGLGALLKRHFGVDVDKSHQRADWSMRPLSPEMLRYAALDTHHLIELAARLQSELEALGRWEWALEEFGRLEEIRYEEPQPDPESFRKIKGSARLERRGLAVLARLYDWRDATARSLDRPPFKVLGNEAMLEIATSMPADMQELERIKGLGAYHLRKHARDILGAVQSALALPESALPQKQQGKPWMRDREAERQIDRLKKVRDEMAASLRIEPAILAPRHVLASIATSRPSSVDDLTAIPAMREWQKRLLGSRLIEKLQER